MRAPMRALRVLRARVSALRALRALRELRACMRGYVGVSSRPSSGSAVTLKKARVANRCLSLHVLSHLDEQWESLI